MENLGKLLSQNAYPGRGIAVGIYHNKVYCAYFIMGRSENSRNRVFREIDGCIVTRAFDESKVTDPSLIIYTAVRSIEGIIIATNGDQTDTVTEFMQNGKTFEQALWTRSYEPDDPNYTPRISAIADAIGCKFSIIKRGTDAGGAAERLFWDYDYNDGQGYFIHTYKGDGNPLPSFEGEPVKIAVEGTPEQFSEEIWSNLNKDNRVALVVCTLDLATGEERRIITNRHETEA